MTRVGIVLALNRGWVVLSMTLFIASAVFISMSSIIRGLLSRIIVAAYPESAEYLIYLPTLRARSSC